MDVTENSCSGGSWVRCEGQSADSGSACNDTQMIKMQTAGRTRLLEHAAVCRSVQERRDGGGTEQMMLGVALTREVVKTLDTMSDQVKDDCTKVKIFGFSTFVKCCEKLNDSLCAAKVCAET